MRKILVGLIVLGVMAGAVPAGAAGSWTWPVVGPVVRGFDPPGSPYGSGHRGIDIAAAVGTVVRAPAPGVVTFAGPVAGRLYVTIDQGGGVLSTCSFLSAVLVRKGDTVAEGQPVALSGTGHAGDVVPDLHLGVRLDGQYVDPLDYLGTPSVVDLIHLAPLVAAG
jgi:murein DD-endopeptidase MepM/ murein hydrolase activator NlpD